MQTQYIVKIWSATKREWRISVEKSLRAAIALTYGLKTRWCIESTDLVRRVCVAEQWGIDLSALSFYATKQFKHNVRAFKQTLPAWSRDNAVFIMGAWLA